MQNVAALEQVAGRTRHAANTALANQKAATDEVQKRTDAANQAATAAQREAAIVAAQRGAYVQELATGQNTTVDHQPARKPLLRPSARKLRVVAEQVRLPVKPSVRPMLMLQPSSVRQPPMRVPLPPRPRLPGW